MRLFIILICLLPSIVFAKTFPAINFQITHDFINNMVRNHNFDKNELLFIFSKVWLNSMEKGKSTTKKSSKKKTMSWDRYKALYITDKRIRDGVIFWQDNLTTLNRAEATYNIPVEIMVAILAIETNFGDKKGRHLTLQVLAKNAFSNHRRQRFYQKELKEFLLMSRENSIPPLTIRGSYAGAIGYPQFIPSSYRYYAVDFDFDGKVDLFSDPVDAIGSIANYLVKHGWRHNDKVALPISLDPSQLKYATFATNKPKKHAQYWRDKGISVNSNIDSKTKLAFISLPQNLTAETWLTFWNFYVLTRYNHDNRYAMAVYQLSQKLKQKFYQ